MSQENVEIVRRAYAAPALLIDAQHVAHDAEFDFRDIYPDQPVLRGVDEMRAFSGSGPWGGSIRFEPDQYLQIDADRVLVLVRVAAIGTGSGAPVERLVAHEFTLHAGLIVRFKVHGDAIGALKAVGLEK